MNDKFMIDKFYEDVRNLKNDSLLLYFWKIICLHNQDFTINQRCFNSNSSSVKYKKLLSLCNKQCITRGRYCQKILFRYKNALLTSFEFIMNFMNEALATNFQFIFTADGFALYLCVLKNTKF